MNHGENNVCASDTIAAVLGQRLVEACESWCQDSKMNGSCRRCLLCRKKSAMVVLIELIGQMGLLFESWSKLRS